MKEVYILIKAGYEGIEKLVDLNKTPRRLLKKINTIKIENENLKKEVLDILGTDDEFVLSKAYDDDVISGEQYSAFTENIKQYCIQKWDGNEFKCYCKELGIKIDETWLY